MALLDFIKNRDVQRPVSEQQSQQQAPETAKQMHTREAAEERANRVAPTPDQEARAKKIGEEMLKGTQSAQERPATVTEAPADQGTNSAHLQNQNHQNKTQEALSPTDGARGKTAVQEKVSAPERAPEQTQKTMARTTPSWER